MGGTQERGGGDSPPPKDQQSCCWGTWDELLLACAVKRHGLHSWDSVSREVQSRSSIPLPLTTPDNCRLRYLDLKRRFSPPPSPDAPTSPSSASDRVVHIPWLEELRKLRVAELQQEVQRYDVSILSLQLKVKKLEEEREESLREKHQKPDLAEDSKGDRSVENKRDTDGEPESSAAAERVATKSAAGEESDRENRSVNESNSTGVKSERDKTGDEIEEGGGGGGRRREVGNEPVRAGNGSEKADRASEGTRPEGVDSYNGSSEPNRERRGEEEGEVEGEGEGGEERPESKENSSDVQSSASLTQKKSSRRKRKGRRLVEISGGEEQPGAEEASPAVDLGGKKESQPLLDVLRMIRAHKHASAFERRLPLQESERYRGMVRQHMDLEGIESRVERGSYSSSLPFYRDLLLLFTNALVFHPKSSDEYLAALDLQRLVSSHFKKTPTSGPTPPPAPAPAPSSHSLSHSQRSSSTPDAPERSDSLLTKNKSSAPIIVCRKRSSMSAQQQPVNSGKKPALDSKPAHEQGLIKMNATKERSVTGTRSLRRSSNKIVKNTSPPPNPPSKKQTPTSTSIEKAENSNSKAEGLVTASTKKRSAADFLKRIKRNSPAGGKSKNSGSESSNNNTSNNKKANSKNNKNRKSEKGGEERKEEGSPSKPRTVGRPPKKGGTPEYSNVKRGREAGGKESASAAALKRPRKRARR